MEKVTKAERKEIQKQERMQYQVELDKAQAKKKLMTWGIIAAAVIIGIVGLFKLSASSTSFSPSSSGTSTKVAPISKTDIATGNPLAKAKLVEYADFQCPGCAAMHPNIKQVLSAENGKIFFIYRFFPLTNIHKNAMAAAEAAYAAYKQGKFWEMHDMLFENQTIWQDNTNAADTFVSYAQKLGLNVDQFKKDVSSDETQKFINDEANVGISNSVNHTPTLYLNGREIQPSGADDLKAMIDAELKK